MRLRIPAVWLVMLAMLTACGVAWSHPAWAAGAIPGPASAEGGGKQGGDAAPTAGLLSKALEAMDGAEEVVFAVRNMYSDGHYYANFGHWSLKPEQMMYAPGGAKLCMPAPLTSAVRPDPRADSTAASTASWVSGSTSVTVRTSKVHVMVPIRPSALSGESAAALASACSTDVPCSAAASTSC